MMEMVNGSRFGVALMGLGIHRRSFLEAAIYAARRTQWGRRIDEYPLVRETLVDLLVDLEAGLAITYECAASARVGRGRRRGAPAAPDPHPAGQDAHHPGRPLGGQHRARGLRRQRLHGRLADGPTAARRPVPHHLGGHREHPLPRRPPGHAGRAGPPGAGGPDRAGARRRRRPQGAGRGGRHRGRGTGRRPPGRRPPRGRSTTTCSCCTRGGWPSCWPTPPRVPCFSTRRPGRSSGDGDARKAAVARRFSTRTLAERPVRGMLDTDRYGARPLRRHHPLRADRCRGSGGLNRTDPDRPGRPHQKPGTYPPWPRAALSKGSIDSSRPPTTSRTHGSRSVRIRSTPPCRVAELMAQELQAPCSWTSTTPTRRRRSPGPGRRRRPGPSRTHELDQGLQLAEALGPLAVAQRRNRVVRGAPTTPVVGPSVRSFAVSSMLVLRSVVGLSILGSGSLGPAANFSAGPETSLPPPPTGAPAACPAGFTMAGRCNHGPPPHSVVPAPPPFPAGPARPG